MLRLYDIAGHSQRLQIRVVHVVVGLITRLHDRANIEQTSNRQRCADLEILSPHQSADFDFEDQRPSASATGEMYWIRC